MISVVRARKDIRPGSVIHIDWIEEILVQEDTCPPNCLPTREDAADKAARKFIPRGKLIDIDDVEAGG